MKKISLVLFSTILLTNFQLKSMHKEDFDDHHSSASEDRSTSPGSSSSCFWSDRDDFQTHEQQRTQLNEILTQITEKRKTAIEKAKAKSRSRTGSQ